MFGANYLKAAFVAAPLALASASASAAFLDFDFKESSVPGTPFNPLAPSKADKIVGNYAEVVTFVPTGPGTGTFATSVKWQAGQFVADDGTNPLLGLFLNAPNMFGGYGLYGLFTATGTYSTTSGGVTTFSFASGSGALSVYIDASVNTTFAAPVSGVSPWTTAGALDDILIATGTVLSGAGTLDPTLPTCGAGINCGSFGVEASFSLTAAGSGYFVVPSPFYNTIDLSGQFNNFVPAGTQTINGSMDAVFKGTPIPAPATLGLFGAGLLGLGAMVRRRA